MCQITYNLIEIIRKSLIFDNWMLNIEFSMGPYYSAEKLFIYSLIVKILQLNVCLGQNDLDHDHITMMYNFFYSL